MRLQNYIYTRVTRPNIEYFFSSTCRLRVLFLENPLYFIHLCVDLKLTSGNNL